MATFRDWSDELYRKEHHRCLEKPHRWQFPKGQDNNAAFQSVYFRWRRINKPKEYADHCVEASRRSEKRYIFDNKNPDAYIRATATAARGRWKRKTSERINTGMIAATFSASHCPLCGREFQHVDEGWKCSPLSPSLDQITPGKGYGKDNIQWVCGQCNVAKGEWPLEYLYSMAEGIYHTIHSTNGVVEQTVTGTLTESD